jgi:hypothetical protein
MNNAQPDAEKSGTLGSVAWAVFIIWVGIAMLANFSWGWFLLGVGILILAAQCARWLMGMKVEGFWIACATVFNAIAVVRPETVLRWHRMGFAAHWRWKSRSPGGPAADRQRGARPDLKNEP